MLPRETILIGVQRQTRDGRWLPVGRVVIELGRGCTHIDPAVDRGIASSVLIGLYRENVAFGSSCLGGTTYRWEEVVSEDDCRHLYN